MRMLDPFESMAGGLPGERCEPTAEVTSMAFGSNELKPPIISIIV
jgi:hypothetical protein